MTVGLYIQHSGSTWPNLRHFRRSKLTVTGGKCCESSQFKLECESFLVICKFGLHTETNSKMLTAWRWRRPSTFRLKTNWSTSYTWHGQSSSRFWAFRSLSLLSWMQAVDRLKTWMVRLWWNTVFTITYLLYVWYPPIL